MWYNRSIVYCIHIVRWASILVSHCVYALSSCSVSMLVVTVVCLHSPCPIWNFHHDTESYSEPRNPYEICGYRSPWCTPETVIYFLPWEQWIKINPIFMLPATPEITEQLTWISHYVSDKPWDMCWVLHTALTYNTLFFTRHTSVASYINNLCIYTKINQLIGFYSISKHLNLLLGNFVHNSKGEVFIGTMKSYT